MNGVVEIDILHLALAYLLLFGVGVLLKLCGVGRSKLLFVATLRMTLQLFVAGLVLTYIFQNPSRIFTLCYLLSMMAFTLARVLKRNSHLRRKFRTAVAFSVACSGTFVVVFFVCFVAEQSFFNPQYIIPIAGMVMGNAMNGVSLGLKSFSDSICGKQKEITTLLGLGCKPKNILAPYISSAMDTAILPNINNMIGMGIVSLPGMMTGQILSGTLPSTAILYQIAIMIAIFSVVCLSTFGSLYLGYKSMISKEDSVIEL